MGTVTVDWMKSRNQYVRQERKRIKIKGKYYIQTWDNVEGNMILIKTEMEK